MAKELRTAVFVHLHCHSHYSFLQAVPSPKILVEAAKNGRFGTIGLTDSSNTCGVVEASEAAEKAGVKLVVGVELWTIEEAQAQAQDEPTPGASSCCSPGTDPDGRISSGSSRPRTDTETTPLAFGSNS